MSETLTLADLRSVDLFEDLTDEQLGEWLEAAVPRTLEPDEVVAEHDRLAPGLILLLDGFIMPWVVDGDRAEPLRRQQPPTWIGATATLLGGPSGIRLQAETRCRIALIPPDDFRRLVLAHADVHGRVMAQVAPVTRAVTAIQQDRERLASLGTMAAGLAHELMNPAAAANRAAALLVEALDVVSSTLGRFVESGVERTEAEQLVALHRQALDGAASRTALDALDAADAEDDVLARLEAVGVAEAWRLAEPLARAGVDQAWLDRVAELAGPATDAAVRWTAASLTAQSLASELRESTERMSELVRAVKSYSYMDRGELNDVDLHEGLETTLVVLGHKLKHVDVTVERQYDRTLPTLMVHGSELNQVWTNLLDNAIDALDGHGTITIGTRREGRCAIVEVSDDGAGIPDDVRPHIFDAFFTTKDVGAGTGLGLATARRIVVDRHHGSLTAESRPGRTTFRVSLPLNGT